MDTAYSIRGIFTSVWDDNPGRQSITMALSSEEAERKAKDLARTEQDKLKPAN